MLYYWWWCTKSSAMLKGHWPAIQSALFCALFNAIKVQNHCLGPQGDLQNSCKMRLVYFFLLIVFCFLAKEEHWSFNNKCHHLCVLEMAQVPQLRVHQQKSPSPHSIPRFLGVLLRIQTLRVLQLSIWNYCCVKNPHWGLWNTPSLWWCSHSPLVKSIPRVGKEVFKWILLWFITYKL